MKRQLNLLFITLCLALPGIAWAQLTGDELMQRVRLSLPTVPLLISGELQSRDRRGNIVQISPLEMRLAWGDTVPHAEYSVLDRFGAVRERVRIEWPAYGETQQRWWTGSPLEEQPLTDLSQLVEGLELSWSDLSLTFLWWEGARRVGSERVRGRATEIVEIPAPAGAELAFDRVRLWIDPEVNLLMRADTLDRRGRMIRRIEVRSLRKIDEIWMIQNLDILSRESRERITLRVREVEQMTADSI